MIAAADVRNPLLGFKGATRIFGPQKGATAERLELLEDALRNFADVIASDFECDFRDEPGAGAAGGLGFGLLSFCRAELRPGFDVVAHAIQLKDKIQRADVVITGEGRLDAQTWEGKAPAGVAKLARRYGKQVYGIVGEYVPEGTAAGLFDRVHALVHGSVGQREAIKRVSELLRERAREIATSVRRF